MTKNKSDEIKAWSVTLSKKTLTNIPLTVSDDDLLEDEFLEMYKNFISLYKLKPINEAGHLLPLTEQMQKKVLFKLFPALERKFS